MKELKSIKIDKNIHKNLKIFCSKNDFKINTILEKIIVEYIKKENLTNDTK